MTLRKFSFFSTFLYFSFLSVPFLFAQPKADPRVQQLLDLSVDSLKKGDSAAALSAIDQAIGIDPMIPQAYAQRGIVQLQARNWPAAIGDATQAIGMNLKIPIVYDIRARGYFETGQFTKALADAEAAISIDTTDAQGYLNRGKSLEAMHGDAQQSLAFYSLAAQYDPSLLPDLKQAMARSHVTDERFIPESLRTVTWEDRLLKQLSDHLAGVLALVGVASVAGLLYERRRSESEDDS